MKTILQILFGIAIATAVLMFIEETALVALVLCAVAVTVHSASITGYLPRVVASVMPYVLLLAVWTAPAWLPHSRRLEVRYILAMFFFMAAAYGCSISLVRFRSGWDRANGVLAWVASAGHVTMSAYDLALPEKDKIYHNLPAFWFAVVATWVLLPLLVVLLARIARRVSTPAPAPR